MKIGLGLGLTVTRAGPLTTAQLIPTVVSNPVISGEGYAGETLTITPATWQDADSSSWALTADGIEIASGTGPSSYVVDLTANGAEFILTDTAVGNGVVNEVTHRVQYGVPTLVDQIVSTFTMAGGNQTIDLSSMDIQEGDLVVAQFGTSGTDDTLYTPPTGWTEAADTRANDSDDANLGTIYKIQTSTVDASLIWYIVNNGGHSAAYFVRVYRNVDPASAVYLVGTNTDINTGHVTNNAITPTLTGSVLLGAGVSALRSNRPVTFIESGLDAVFDNHDQVLYTGGDRDVSMYVGDTAWSGVGDINLGTILVSTTYATSSATSHRLLIAPNRTPLVNDVS